MKIEQQSEHKVPKRKQYPTITPKRAAEAFYELLTLRRMFLEDERYAKLTEYLDILTDDNADTRIKTFDAKTHAQEVKAGSLALFGKVIFIVSNQLLEKARKGCKLANFTLAHEFAHVELGHHEDQKIVKNFQLFSTEQGQANIPPTDEELEANFGATFFQCGVALLDPDADPISLANRAYTDVGYVKKSLRICQSEVFRKELEILTAPKPRAVL
ncbi:hypothetical protein [uncultured Roseobacter sp.]|uniref:hypothetical protein n=1 Tax=uncultured Roseobacter sp. TaxID=114847 RepID=UPI002628B5B5|nr:hypothetical protein [uncultured Roseobacter sp.]